MFTRASARVQGCVRIFSSASSAVLYIYLLRLVLRNIPKKKKKFYKENAGLVLLHSFFSFFFFILCAQGEVQSGRPPSRSNSSLPPRPAWRRVSQPSSGSALNLPLPLPPILSLSVCRIGKHPRAKTATGAPASGPRVGWRAATERSPRTGRALCRSLRLGGFVFFSSIVDLLLRSEENSAGQSQLSYQSAAVKPGQEISRCCAVLTHTHTHTLHFTQLILMTD